MIRTQNIFMERCYQSEKLFCMTDDQRIKLQDHLRKMYLEVEKVCTKHGLTMMVAYGSVLGAVRHQGFIPWDDDMDIFMPRDDYNKFINFYCDDLPQNYRVYAPNGKNPAIERFAKVVDLSTSFVTIDKDVKDESCGIFLDIFPLENTPTGKWHIKLRQYYTYILSFIARSVYFYKNAHPDYKELMCSSAASKRNYYLRNILGLLFSWRSYSSWCDRIDKFNQYKQDTGYYSRPAGPAGPKSFMPIKKDVYIPTSRGKFDNIEVFLPNQPIKFCEIQYGKWQQLPPENERWQHFVKVLNFSK